jgi:hypothetical protein
MNRAWCVFVFLLVAGSVSAQEPQITSDTVLDSATLEKWLHGDDPRLIAWAADYTRRNPNPEILQEMPPLVEHWSIPLDYARNWTLSLQIQAYMAVLDTLIQANVSVPIYLIDQIAPFFPAQAAILISRHPLSASRSTLFDWTWQLPGRSGASLARIAAMMLASDADGSDGARSRELVQLVGKVVSDSETEVRVTLVSPGQGEGSGGSTTSCGDGGGSRITSGWPEVFAYDLRENIPDSTTLVVVELDGDRIVSRRRPVNDFWGSCDSDLVEALDAITRHRLIAYWLGVPDEDMDWQPTLDATIVWAGESDYEQRLGGIVESQREKLRATVSALKQRGYLGDWAVVPPLSIRVSCMIDPCPLHSS